MRPTRPRRAALVVLAALLALLAPVAPAIADGAASSSSGAAVFTGSVTEEFAIIDDAPAASYPSPIVIDAPDHIVDEVVVDLVVSHSRPADLDIMLEAPDGRAVMLMSDVACTGTGTWRLRIDQRAEESMPLVPPMPDGTYRPTNLDSVCGNPDDDFPAPAPTTWTDSLDDLVGSPADGAWRLWVTDDTPGHSGFVREWSLTVTASPREAPEFTGAMDLEVALGVPFAHRIAVSGIPAPVVIATSTMPDGVSLEDGVLQGTPTTAGTYDIAILAMNSAGSQTSLLTLVVREPPRITSPTEATAAVGSPFTYHFTVTGYPGSFSVVESGLPPGVHYASGALTGTPEAAGVYTVEAHARNSVGSFIFTLELTVLEAPAGPVIDLADGQAPVTNAQPVDFTITFATEPVGFDAGDVEVVGTAGGGTLGLTGGPLVWTASVTGLDGDGTVGLRVPFGAWTDADGFLGEGASGPEGLLDTVAPVIGDVDDVTVQLREGETSALVEFEPPSASDNSGQVEVTCDPAPGTALGVGEHRVTCTAQDPSGNTATTSFTVTVLAAEAAEDDEPGDDGVDDGIEDDGTEGDDVAEEDGTEGDDVVEDDDEDRLPVTGASLLVPVGLALLLLGAGMTLATMRRRAEG